MDQVEFFKCLADQTRLDLLMLMVKQGERCVCDFTATLDLSQPKISRHLALLRSTALVQDRRQGQWVYYRLHDQLPAWCLDVLNRIAAEDQRFDLVNSSSCESLNCCE
ncbi:metalloregulator ArsR/SmtB family transcription factor [Acinetobacter bouvetii]|uniref:Arsenical resistance operon repressor n=1 Tax=Acinetobacter bouvetii TaxID=202951 RepID=A0A811GE46_9GAMM|nr:metalloregulator ArsR/SmtB family transcription factor [Acinetobacter bouvetii]CAB1214012.1 Arsenical resistance operon repressor [Acinetobacter bouvetii]